MWFYRTNLRSSSNDIILYDWQPSRKADHPREFSKNFSGTVITDGYQVYHKLSGEREDLNIAGCWVHARRPFAEFIKSVGSKAVEETVAKEAYDMITEIMHIDNVNLNLKKKLMLTLSGLNSNIPMLHTTALSESPWLTV